MVTAWNNGSESFGFRITKADRDKFFSNNWKGVEIILPNSEKINVGISSSFWKKCHELRNKEIGNWLKSNGKDNWKKYNPPKFNLIPIEKSCFRVTIE